MNALHELTAGLPHVGEDHVGVLRDEDLTEFCMIFTWNFRNLRRILLHLRAASGDMLLENGCRLPNGCEQGQRELLCGGISPELGVVSHNGLESCLDRSDAVTEHGHPFHQEHAFVCHEQAERFRELLSAEDLAQRELRDLVLVRVDRAIDHRGGKDPSTGSLNSWQREQQSAEH